jgi:peptidoglycan/LPS O-acetylase OafA/YrhL
MPGLDGLRAIAVLAVIAYHLKFSWAPGGLLGVGVFFTLSGYLITDILLADAARGGIRLTSFYLARARRLLPALFVVLVVVLAWVTVIGPHQPSDFREAVGTAAFYVNNWWLILHDVSYFQQFAKAPPLNHLWSLSIEEQFYILWPFMLMLGLRLVPGSKLSIARRARLGGVTLGLAVVSAVVMALLYKPGLDPSRVYYGTDTRAFELLIGAALAMVWPSRRLHGEISETARKLLDGAGAAGLLVVFALFWRAQQYDPFLYRGGFVLLTVATALVVAVLVHPASKLAAVVGCRPMRWIGERSYGIYLWHFPIIILTSPDDQHSVRLPLAAVQLAATIVVSALSWRYIENPIRRGALKRLRDDVRERRWNRERVRPLGWAGLAAIGLCLIAATAGLAGVNVTKGSSAATPGNIDVSETITASGAPLAADHTVCESVIHIGDSTSEGLVSADYLPSPRSRIGARYAEVGATTAHLEVSGARSIYERYQGQPNANDVAVTYKDKSFRGCWVLALGTNEAADVAAGSTVGYDERIRIMMSTIGNQPVLWVNVKSLLKSGPYSQANMKAWDKALERACDAYPNMRIYDWASDVEKEWFIPDGIHFTTPGYRMRARLIAEALLEAFPAEGGPGEGCLIHPTLPTTPRVAPTGPSGPTGKRRRRP